MASVWVVGTLLGLRLWDTVKLLGFETGKGIAVGLGLMARY